MKILWLSWRDIKNPTSGGAEKIETEITKRLVKDDHSVTLYTSRFKNSKAEETINGVKIIRSGNRLTCHLHALSYYLKSKNFDLVIDEINTIPFFTPLFAKSKSLTIIYQLAREYWFSEAPFPVNLLGYLLEPAYLSLYKNQPTITISQSTKTDLAHLGFKNVNLIRVGLDIKPISVLKPRQNLILLIGRLTQAKGPQDAIKAFKSISKRYPDYKLIIAGRGEESFVKNLKSLTKNLEINKKVEFKGYISDREKFALLKKAKIILIPAVREGWNLVATEASATGCVPIGYDVPGLRDSIINGKTGILVEKSPDKLAHAAIDLLSNDAKRSKLAESGLEFAKKFSWDNTYKDFKKIMERYGRTE